MRNRRKIRGGVALVVAAFTLVGATQAFGALSPKVAVGASEVSNTTTVTYTQPATDDALGKLTLYVPASAFVPAAQLSGDPVGTATAKFTLGTLSGSITGGAAADTVTIASVNTTLSAAWTACVGTPPGFGALPGAVTTNYWVMNLTGGGATVQIPLFFTSINQDQPFGDAFLASITFCVPSTLKLTDLTINLVDVISSVPGWNQWAIRATPYSGTSLNNAGAVELAAQDRLPWEVTLAAKAAKAKGKVAVSGKVKQGSAGVSGASIEILAGKKVVGTLKSKGGGNYSGTVTTTAKSLTAKATGPGTYAG